MLPLLPWEGAHWGQEDVSSIHHTRDGNCEIEPAYDHQGQPMSSVCQTADYGYPLATARISQSDMVLEA